MSQPKSIDEYKKIVKILKVKVLKLTEQNNELKKKLEEPITAEMFDQDEITRQALELNQKAQQIQSMWKDHKGSKELSELPGERKIYDKHSEQNEITMKQFGEAANRIGLTPEMLFRAADTDGQKRLSVEQFRNFLNRMKLGLTDSQISRILFLCDESCSGIIMREDYYNLLSAYEINQELNNINGRSFGQLSLLKLAHLFLKLRLTVENSFVKLDKQNRGFINQKDLQEYIDQIRDSDINDKEIVAAFRQIDIDKSGKIKRELYLEQMKKAYRIVAQEQGVSLSILEQNIKNQQQGVSETNQQSVFQRQSVVQAANKENQLKRRVKQNVRDPEDLSSLSNQLIPLTKNLGVQARFQKIIQKENGILTVQSETIFSNELACLQRALQLAEALKNADDKKFKDKEFGKTEIDQTGFNSITSRELGSSFLSPNEIQWCSPEQIISYHFKNSKTAQTDKKDPPRPEFWKGGTKVIQSSYLGNCYLISALSILANDERNIVGDYQVDEDDYEMVLDSAQYQGMKQGVWPPLFHFLSLYGIYVFKFYKDHEWRYVIVDDRIPCNLNFEPLFARSADVTEYWVSLIEKAYAKLHHNYFNLQEGDIGEALSDLTGYFPDRVKIDDKFIPLEELRFNYYKDRTEFKESGGDQMNMINQIATQVKKDLEEDSTYLKEVRANSDELWRNLLSYKKQGTLMGASVDPQVVNKSYKGKKFVELNQKDTGIMYSHAYAILDVFELPYSHEEKEKMKNKTKQKNSHGNHRILRLRNPWGEGGWKLKWSRSEDQNEFIKQHLVNINKYYDSEIERAQRLSEYPPERYDHLVEDGTFLICFKDFRKIFRNIHLSLNFPEQFNHWVITGNWGAYSGSTGENLSAGRPTEQNLENYATQNPQYVIKIYRDDDQATQIYLGLSQPDGRLIDGLEYPYEKHFKQTLLSVFRLDKNEERLLKYSTKSKITDTKTFQQNRDCSSGLFQLDNNKYALIPCTYSEGESGKFFISIYTDLPIDNIEQIMKKATGDFKLNVRRVRKQVDPNLVFDTNPQDWKLVEYIKFNTYGNQFE